MHDQHNHPESHQHDDPSLLKRISGISVLNFLIGTFEIAAGIATNSATITMAGVHDEADGGLYAIKRRAAGETDPERKLRLRRWGAGLLMTASVIFGGYEVASNIADEDHRPDPAAAWVGVIAATANVAATATLHSKKHHHDAHDSWRHVVEVDLPGSLMTMAITPLSVKYPGLDTVGAIVHTGLAVRVGKQTFSQTNGNEARSH
jgi:Co/Zn/Cd efflux system component